MSVDDAGRVEAANAAFYAAVEAGDMDALEQLWDDGDDLWCVHPGWQPLRGRTAVMRSWTLIMANTGYIQFFLTDLAAVIDGDSAIVTCTENILTDIAATEGDARVVTTNGFRRRDGRWRLWLHHGSPVIVGESDG